MPQNRPTGELSAIKETLRFCCNIHMPHDSIADGTIAIAVIHSTSVCVICSIYPRFTVRDAMQIGGEAQDIRLAYMQAQLNCLCIQETA